MKNKSNFGWKHPGRRSSDYSQSENHDHDRRNYASNMSYFGKGPQGYQRKDERIREEVCEILLWNHDVDARDVEVDVEQGVVILRGSVDSRHAKKTSERILDGVLGVHDIRNELTIRPCLDLNSDKVITRGEDGLFSQETIER